VDKGEQASRAGALSRHPNDDPQREDTVAEYHPQLEPEASISEMRSLLSTGPTLPVRFQELQDKVAQDHEYQELHSTILNGFPAHRHQLPETCKRYWALKEHLSIDDGLII